MLVSPQMHICCHSVPQSCPTLCDPMDCSMPGFPVLHCISWSLLKLRSTELVMPSNHLILFHLLLPSLFPSIRSFPMSWLFTSGGFSFSISPSNEYSGLISFRIDWFDVLAVQGNSQESSPAPQVKRSILRHLAVFLVQLSHTYMTTGKTIAFDCMDFCLQSDVAIYSPICWYQEVGSLGGDQIIKS